MTVEELRKAITSGLFAYRENLEEAFKYVQEISKANENPMSVWTAVMVVCNTIAKELKNA
jgi:hypothetical protein